MSNIFICSIEIFYEKKKRKLNLSFPIKETYKKFYDLRKYIHWKYHGKVRIASGY